jgi:hypothetical protein
MRTSLRVFALFALAAGCGGRSELSTGGPRQLPGVSRDAALVRRKSAEQIVNGLKAQLGLADADIFAGSYRDPAPELYPARSPDAIPQIGGSAESNYLAIGGPSWLKSKKGSAEPSTVFAQQLVPMPQAWCRLAVQKAGTPLLVDASLSDSSSSPQGRDRIRRNIARLHLRMLGEPASDADILDLLDLFQVYEPGGSDVAWTAICAALVRHPLWITL